MIARVQTMIMGNSRVLLVLLVLSSLILVHFVALSSAQEHPLYHICLNAGGNFTANSAYGNNLNGLLSSFPSNTKKNNGFYKNSLGEGSDKVYALALCRGDVQPDDCLGCVANATSALRSACPNQKEAYIWYDYCMLRYSNNDTFGEALVQPAIFMWNIMNNTSPDEPYYGALGLIFSLMEEVPYRKNMFGTDDKEVADGFQHRYCLVQCSRDLNNSSCGFCLTQLSDQINTCCRGKIGWRILFPSCSIRYEQYPFYAQPSAPSQPVPPPEQQPLPNDKGKGENNTRKVVIVVVSSLAAALVPILLVFWYCSTICRKTGRKGGTSEQIPLRSFNGSKRRCLMEEGMHETEEDQSEEMHYFSLTAIHLVTDNFSDANKLGEGGFGPVYKGTMPNGTEVAVKRLSMKSSQGLEEFKNEVKLIFKLQHKNLVRLLGYCLDRDEKILIYEYMANTSLDVLLFDPIKCMVLDWEKRANIITGTARGLQYLHEDSRLKVIHRDLKASNVLLDDEMNPKISDFGTARIFGGKQLEANTERVVGTYGYMAPEYALEGLFSTKSDVYSFGVLMLEMISGKKNRGFYHLDCGQNLLTYAWLLWTEGRGQELIDPNMVGFCPIHEVLRWIHIALLCIQDDPAHRPNMSSIVLMLRSESVNLPQPSAPPYSAARFVTMSDQSSISGPRTDILTSDQYTTSAST